MKRLILALALLASILSSCGGLPTPPQPTETKLQIKGVILPHTIEVRVGEDLTLVGKGFEVGDVILLDGELDFEIPIKAATVSDVTFTIPEGFRTGQYTIFVRRGAQELKLGTSTFNLIADLDLPDKPGMTIKGVVYCDGIGVPDVVVSDGFEVTKTDQNGVYYLASQKKHGYVFISVPGGYKVATKENIIPQFFARLTGNASSVEQRDFSLTPQEQGKHAIFVMGDIHAANRISSNNDLPQFSAFISEISSYASEFSSTNNVPVYGFTLGDMSWDQYWLTQKFDLTSYLGYAKNLAFPVYHTIGNHDHSCYASGDWATVDDYKTVIGPTYYSVNIGKAHYIVLDDIECTNNGSGPDGRSYNTRLVNDQIEWIKKDLAMLDDKTAPVFVTMHAPLYYTSISGGKQVHGDNLGNTSAIVALFSEFTNVHFLTGHTHIARNVDIGHLFDHNIPAVCATWWWTGKLSGNNICCDGAPGGYAVFEIENKDVKWYYKGTGESAEKQFRTYDLNSIHLTPELYTPNANETYKAMFTSSFAGVYANQTNDNSVLINVWNWDKDWKVEVMEGANSLTVSQVQTTDPLSIISYAAKRLNGNNKPTFNPTNTPHMFKVKASSPTSTLEIKVTDRFGRVYTETMTRPKALALNQ